MPSSAPGKDQLTDNWNRPSSASCSPFPAALHLLQHAGCTISHRGSTDAVLWLQVGHVAVKESRLVRTRSYAEGDIHASAQANFFGNLLAKLLGMLRNQPHGQYLLTHVPGSDVIDCLKALPGNDRKVCRHVVHLLSCTLLVCALCWLLLGAKLRRHQVSIQQS